MNEAQLRLFIRRQSFGTEYDNGFVEAALQRSSDGKIDWDRLDEILVRMMGA